MKIDDHIGLVGIDTNPRSPNEAFLGLFARPPLQVNSMTSGRYDVENQPSASRFWVYIKVYICVYMYIHMYLRVYIYIYTLY